MSCGCVRILVWRFESTRRRITFLDYLKAKELKKSVASLLARHRHTKTFIFPRSNNISFFFPLFVAHNRLQLYFSGTQKMKLAYFSGRLVIHDVCALSILKLMRCYRKKKLTKHSHSHSLCSSKMKSVNQTSE